MTNLKNLVREENHTTETNKEENTMITTIETLLSTLEWTETDEFNDTYYLTFTDGITATISISDYPEAKYDEDYFDNEQTLRKALIQAQMEENIYNKDGEEINLEK